MDSAAAEAHVRLLAEASCAAAAASPRYLWLDEDFRAGGLPPEEDGLLRVSGGPERLSKVGVLSRGSGRPPGAEFAAALAAAACAPLRPGQPGSGQRGEAGLDRVRAAEAAGSPAAVRLAAGIGPSRSARLIPAEWDGHLG